MNNHWLKCADKKRLFKEIDEIAMELWTQEGNLADLMLALNTEQTHFLMNMLIKDFMASPDDMSFGFDLSAP